MLLVTGFFTGNITTVVVAAGVATVLGIAVVVPLAMLAAWLLFLVGHGMATVERSRYLAYTGLDLVDPGPPLDGHNAWTRFLGRFRSPGRWRELIYLLLRLPVSTVLMTLALVVWAGSVALVALPL